MKESETYESLYKHYKDLYYESAEKLHWYRMCAVLIVLPLILVLLLAAILL